MKRGLAMNDIKQEFLILLNKLTDRQIEYLYHLVKMLFCHTSD